MEPFAQRVREELQACADPGRAVGMARYMKHRQAFLGVPAGEVKRIVKELGAGAKPAALSECEPGLRDLWNGQWREERYAAFRLADRWKVWRWPEALPLFEWMVRRGQWWDLVDTIAARLIGPLIRHHPHLRPAVFGFIRSDDLWLRRTALLAQLKFKTATDTAVLGELILGAAHEREFFIRKAIGWALREYGKTDPDWVRAFVAEHQARLSPLSRREALKNLG